VGGKGFLNQGCRLNGWGKKAHLRPDLSSAPRMGKQNHFQTHPLFSVPTIYHSPRLALVLAKKEKRRKTGEKKETNRDELKKSKKQMKNPEAPWGG